jgi:WD40 repeat protein
MESLFADIDADQDAYSKMVDQNQNRLKDLVGRLREENRQLREENAALRAGRSVPDAAARTLAAPAQQGQWGSGNGPIAKPTDLNATYVKTKIIRTHDAPVHSVAMSKHGLLATGSWDATVTVYDLAKEDTEALLKTLGVDDGSGQPEECIRMGGLYDVAFSPSNPDILGCASADKLVYLWKIGEGRMIHKLIGHRDEVNGCIFHPSQQVMCTTSDDCMCNIWDYMEGVKLRSLEEHGKAVYGAAFFGKEAEYNVATCCFDQKVRVFDMRDRIVVQTLTGHQDDIIGIDYCNETKQLITGSDDGTMLGWDARKWGKPLFRIDTRTDPGDFPANEVKRLKISPNGKKVSCGTSSMNALVYDISGPKSQCIATCRGHTDCVFDTCWGVDRRGCEYLVDASHDHTSYVWRLPS